MYCLQKDSEVYRLPGETAEVVEKLKVCISAKKVKALNDSP